MRWHQQISSCTSNQFLTAATTSPAPATTSLQQQLPVLHRQLLPSKSRHQRTPSCSSDHLRAAVTTFLQQHLPVLHQKLPALHQWPPSCSSDNHPSPATTSSAPAATSPAPATSFLQQRPSSCTSNYQFCTTSL